MNAMNLVGLALGGIMLVSLGQLIDLVRFRWRGTRTIGRVTSLEREDTGEGSPVFAPAVEYLVNGQTWTIRPLIARWPAPYQVGQDVPV
jgi:hypothetical protein